ncbi:19646_t:CDS:1, partial [Cetraspora pellucida]
EVKGILPYLAPEVLREKQFSRASDIYALGVIMTEIANGKRSKCKPEFDFVIPDCYVKLAERCIDSDLKKRPTVKEIWKKVDEWNELMKSSDDENEVKKQFLEADKIIKTLPISVQDHDNDPYTSKIISDEECKTQLQSLELS